MGNKEYTITQRFDLAWAKLNNANYIKDSNDSIRIKPRVISSIPGRPNVRILDVMQAGERIVSLSDEKIAHSSSTEYVKSLMSAIENTVSPNIKSSLDDTRSIS